MLENSKRRTIYETQALVTSLNYWVDEEFGQTVEVHK